jgi:hypothetical protein
MVCQLIIANYIQVYVLFQFMLDCLYIVVDIFTRAEICCLAWYVNVIWVDCWNYQKEYLWNERNNVKV